MFHRAKNQRQRRRSKTRVVIIALCAVAVFGLAGLATASWFGTPLNSLVTGKPVQTPKTFLLMGERGNLKNTPFGSGGSRLTDSMIVVHLEPKHHRIIFLSVPRDTRVNLAGHGTAKINAANAYGGPSLAMHTVNGLLGTHITNYVMVNFSGFEAVVNTLGGVKLDVKEPMYYQGGPNTSIDLSSGVQRLNGRKALEFVRYRRFPLGDIQRTLDQQEFILAVLHQFLQPGTILKLPSLAVELRRAVQTNVPLGQMMAIGAEAKQMEHDRIIHETLPGAFLNLNLSYWEVLPGDARKAWQALLAGKTMPLFDPAAQAAAKSLVEASHPVKANPPAVTGEVYGQKASGQPNGTGTLVQQEPATAKAQNNAAGSVTFRALPGPAGGA